MAARYVEVTKAEFASLMLECGFHQVKDLHNVYELVWQRPHANAEFVVRVFSSILPDGMARQVGTDAIRVVLLHVLSNKIVWSTTRVHRTQGWREKTRKRMREAWMAVAKVKRCPKCNERPMVERSGRHGQFYGCVGWPNECDGTLKKEAS